MSGRGRVKGKAAVSKTKRAGIIFPVSRVLKYMRLGPFYKYRIAAGAPVYMAAVMEYLCAEVIFSRFLIHLFFPGQLAFCKKAVLGLAARRIFLIVQWSGVVWSGKIG